MKNILIIFTILSFYCCTSNSDNDSHASNNSVSQQNKKGLKYEIDTSKWYLHSPSIYLDFLEKKGGEFDSVNEIVACYTLTKKPVLNYPFILISKARTPFRETIFDDINSEENLGLDLNQLEEKFDAKIVSIEDFEKQNEIMLAELIENLNRDKPIMIKEKNLILMKNSSQDDQELHSITSFFMKSHLMIYISFSYTENQDEKHLIDLCKIINTMKY